MRKKNRPVKPNGEVVRVNNTHWTRNQERFFSGCKNRAAVSDLIATLAAGHTVTAVNVPTDLLPCVLLLHCVAPEPGIVDDILTISTAIEEEYEAKDHGVRFWHPEGFLVGRIVRGWCDADMLNEIPDTQYIYSVYQELTNDEKRKALFGWIPKTRSKA